LLDFVEDEFDAFLEYRVLAYGFLRLRCADCAHAAGRHDQLAQPDKPAADWKLNDRVSVGGGFHRGMENCEDNNNLNGFGVRNWASCDENTSFSFVFDICKEDDAGQAILSLHRVIFEKEIFNPL
jgi:hypothetical protein